MQRSQHVVCMGRIQHAGNDRGLGRHRVDVEALCGGGVRLLAPRNQPQGLVELASAVAEHLGVANGDQGFWPGPLGSGNDEVRADASGFAGGQCDWVHASALRWPVAWLLNEVDIGLVADAAQPGIDFLLELAPE